MINFCVESGFVGFCCCWYLLWFEKLVQTANDHKSNSFVDCIRSAHKLHDSAICGLHLLAKPAVCIPRMLLTRQQHCSPLSLGCRRSGELWLEWGKGHSCPCLHGSSANNSDFYEAKTTGEELLAGVFIFFGPLLQDCNFDCIVIKCRVQG